VNRPRAADDFATIRARMEELRREREVAHAAESEAKSDTPMRSYRNGYWSQQEFSAGQGGSDNLARYAARAGRRFVGLSVSDPDQTRPRW
jgi:hypothetical protein